MRIYSRQSLDGVARYLCATPSERLLAAARVCIKALQSGARKQFEPRFNSRDLFEIPIIVEQRYPVFNRNPRDKAIMRAPWRDAAFAATHVKLRGGLPSLDGVGGIEERQCAEVVLEFGEMRRCGRTLQNFLVDHRSERGLPLPQQFVEGACLLRLLIA